MNIKDDKRENKEKSFFFSKSFFLTFLCVLMVIKIHKYNKPWVYKYMSISISHLLYDIINDIKN